MLKKLSILILLSFYQSPATGQEPYKFGGLELFGKNNSSNELLPAEDLNLSSKKLTIPTGQYQWQLETQLADELKNQGIVPNATAFGLLYNLNNVNSLSELAGQTDIEVIERLNLLNPNSLDQQIELVTDVSGKEKFITNTNTLNEAAANGFKHASADLRKFFWINQTVYSDFANAIETAAIPLSEEFVSMLNYETETIAALQEKVIQGETLQASEIKLLEIAANDNLVRQELLKSASPVTGGILGNGEAFVKVTLTDSAGMAVNNQRIRAVAPLNDDATYSLGTLTSPASGSVPMATFCYFAIDPKSDQRVSDNLKYTLQAIVAGQGRPIQLAYIGPQQEIGSCTR